MEKGYVYVGRLVDHNGNYVSDYHKIGKSFDFKTREINLSSTHLPVDVHFVRVFETQHMSDLERVLHACFHEYRVIKEYGWRRKVTTEWFELTEPDLFSYKLDNVIKYFPNTTEVDLIEKVMLDSGSTTNQKVLAVHNIKETKKKWKLNLFINGEDCSEDLASETMVNAFSYICNKVGFDVVVNDEMYLSNDKDLLSDQFKNWSGFSSGLLKEFDGHYLFTGLGNKRKSDTINNMVKRYGLTEIICNVEQID